MTFKTKTISYDTRFRVFWFLVFVFVVSIVVYIVAVRNTIGNTITRARLEATTNSLATAVGDMEFKYISLENNISLKLAYDKGFQNVTSPIYISRANSRALSMNTSSNFGTISR
jgi:hypothetical protein